ncbi:hypothetical protein CLOM_g17326 [Closterium sp. NIES-68]|nr:hypothetical protein CLOM_g17326 [Closterium sp. NIES-68]
MADRACDVPAGSAAEESSGLKRKPESDAGRCDLSDEGCEQEAKRRGKGKAVAAADAKGKGKAEGARPSRAHARDSSGGGSSEDGSDDDAAAAVRASREWQGGQGSQGAREGVEPQAEDDPGEGAEVLIVAEPWGTVDLDNIVGTRTRSGRGGRYLGVTIEEGRVGSAGGGEGSRAGTGEAGKDGEGAEVEEEDEEDEEFEVEEDEEDEDEDESEEEEESEEEAGSDDE